MNDAEKQNQNPVVPLKLSLCITTYNRPEMTIRAFEKVYEDARITEIIIVDDASSHDNVKKLHRATIPMSKVRLYFNHENIGMSRNKTKSIELATSDWCILFDSDNILDKDYLDAFERFVTLKNGDCPIMYDPKHKKTIFCPDFAKPYFDYTIYSSEAFGGIYGADMAQYLIRENMFNCLMNTCNYIVHRQMYLDTYNYNADHIASDTIWHNYNHLKVGGVFAVVPGMQYYHEVHDGSGFKQNIDYNMRQAEKVRRLIIELCS